MASYREDLKTFYRQLNKIIFNKGSVNLRAVWIETFKTLFSGKFVIGLLHLIMFSPLATVCIVFVYLAAPAIVGTGRLLRKLRRLARVSVK